MSVLAKSLGRVTALISNSELLTSFTLNKLTLKSYKVFADKSFSDTSLFTALQLASVGFFIIVCKLAFAPLVPLTSISYPLISNVSANCELSIFITIVLLEVSVKF